MLVLENKVILCTISFKAKQYIEDLSNYISIIEVIMNKRLDYIDTAKGIGIILVVIYHHLLGAEFINNWISSFHMPLFFMITGYLYAFRDDYTKPVGEFIVQKLKGLMYPFVTLSFIVILWNAFFYNILFPSVTPENSTLEIFWLTITTYGYHALWFVPCLFYSSVIFYVLRKYLLHHWILAIIVLFAVVFTIVPGADIFTYYPVRFFVRILIGLMFIYFGYLFFRLLSKIQKRWQLIILIGSGLVSVLSFIGYYLYPGLLPFINIGVCHIEKPIIYLFLALSGSSFIILLSQYIGNKVLGFFGKNSLIIMAFHMDLTIEVAWLIEGRIPWNVNGTIQSATVIAIELVMLVIMILLINRFVPFLYQFRKLPFLKNGE